MELREVIRHRRMVRAYDPERPVPPDVVRRALEHAVRACASRIALRAAGQGE